MAEGKGKNGYEPINMTYDIPIENHKDLSFASYFTKAIKQNFDTFLATQLTLIAKEKGVSIADLCLCHDDINTAYQRKDGIIRFWVEVK